MRLSPERALLCLQVLVEGNSVRSIERITGVHRDTITHDADATIIHFRKPHRDREPDVYLALGVQEGQNPNRLSIEQYFAQQLQAMKTIPPPTGHVTVGGQPAVFLENTNSLGTERVTYALLHETGLLTFIYTRQAQFDPILAAIVSTFRFIR